MARRRYLIKNSRGNEKGLWPLGSINSIVFKNPPLGEILADTRRFCNVIFIVTEDDTGADPFSAGNIGLEFLKPFKLIFDYPNARVAMIKLAK